MAEYVSRFSKVVINIYDLPTARAIGYKYVVGFTD